jgi:hypothetical protein
VAYWAAAANTLLGISLKGLALSGSSSSQPASLVAVNGDASIPAATARAAAAAAAAQDINIEAAAVEIE